ncbi:MAG: outer membrane protein transport protein [Bacteroidetes bacterium]|nr:outer membrane protein transport protein [Bacteroidota bacterium]
MKRFALALIALATATALMAQNGTKLIDYNAKSLGRGGTSIGVFDSPNLMMTNPAGLSFLGKPMVDANFSLMIPTVKFKNNLNDKEGDQNYFPMPSVSGTWPCLLSDKVTMGAGFFTSGGMGADFKLKHALYSEEQDYHSMLAMMQGGLSAAYRINDNMSAGITLHLVYSMLEFQMPYSLNPSVMKGTAQPNMTFGMMFAAPPANGGFGYDEVTASAEMKDLSALGFNGKLGFAWKVNDELTVGASYSLPVSLTYTDGKANMDMTAQLNDAFGKAVMGYMAQNPGSTQEQAQGAVAVQFGNMGIDLSKGVKAEYDLDVDLKFPQTVGVGASYKVLPELKVSADVEWVNWSAAFDKMTLKLKNGSNANVNTMMGSSDLTIDFPLDWKDAVVVKLGAEYEVIPGLFARGGYAYGTNPVPEGTVFPVFPAVVEHHFMLGGSYTITPNFTLHAAWEMAPEKSLTATNPSQIANQFDGSVSTLGTQLFHISGTFVF